MSSAVAGVLPLLLRQHSSNAAVPTALGMTGLHFGRCCSQQATFLVQNGAQAQFLQMQQLHTTVRAAAAAPAAVTAAPTSQPSQQRAGLATLQSSASTSSSQLQPIPQPPPGGVLSSVLTGLGSKQMDGQHVGLYYDFHRDLVPEAFKPFHQAFYSPRPAKQQRDGGCRALQAEFNLTRSSSLMWRRATHELQAALSSGVVPRVYLQGPGGSGKSIAVAQMVEWARSSGWIALYVPSAVDLTRGGFFYRRGKSDTFDTIISAQHILKSMADSHAADLVKLPLQLDASKQLLGVNTSNSGAAAAADAGAAAPSDSSSSSSAEVAVAAADGGDAQQQQAAGRKKGAKKGGGSGAPSAADVEGTLMQLVVAGLTTDSDGKLAVECCLSLIKEIAAISANQPVLLAVDDYNALYWKTDYGTTLFREPADGPAYSVRKPLSVTQLNLARKMRLLARSDLGACRVLVADSSSNRVPAAASEQVPTGGAAVYHMPRFSEVETAHALHYYHERGLTAQPPSGKQVAAMRALTNGSGTDLRKWCLKVTQTDMGLL